MRSRRAERGITAVEAAIAFAVIGGAVCAVAPACVRSVRLARTAEAAENVGRLVEAGAHHVDGAASPALSSTPLTPAVVPRGTTAADPPGSWDHPTWKALGFSLDEPHAYAYRVDVDVDPVTAIRVIAHGDLDGDGVLSTFERRAVREGGRVVAQPGLVVTSDLE